jgi:hypothetical protein
VQTENVGRLIGIKKEMEPLTRNELIAIIAFAIFVGIVGGILVDTFIFDNAGVTSFIQSYG